MNRKDVVTAGVMINEYDRLTDLLMHLDQGAEIELMTNGGESLDIGHVSGLRESVIVAIRSAKIDVASDLREMGVSLEEDEPQLPMPAAHKPGEWPELMPDGTQRVFAPSAIPPAPVPPWPAAVPHGPTCNCGSCQDREEHADAIAKRYGLQGKPKT